MKLYFSVFICDTAQNLIAVKKLLLIEVQGPSKTSMHLKIVKQSFI